MRRSRLVRDVYMLVDKPANVLITLVEAMGFRWPLRCLLRLSTWAGDITKQGPDVPWNEEQDEDVIRSVLSERAKALNSRSARLPSEKQALVMLSQERTWRDSNVSLG
jgi:hypothetical protein